MITELALSPDEQVQRHVLDELHWNMAVKPSEIGVEVASGVVTLTGTVDNSHKKWLAEQTVLGVEGIRAVANELQVRLPVPDYPTDTEIACSALKALDWNPSIPQGRVKVGVSGRNVVLEGTVNRQFEKIAAERTVLRVSGVKELTNLLSVRSDKSCAVPLD